MEILENQEAVSGKRLTVKTKKLMSDEQKQNLKKLKEQALRFNE
jgi:hypothetical protein